MAELLVDLLNDAVSLRSDMSRWITEWQKDRVSTAVRQKDWVSTAVRQKDWVSTVYATVGLARHHGYLDQRVLFEYSAYGDHLSATNIWGRDVDQKDIVKAVALLDYFIKYCKMRVPVNQGVPSR